jgi:hypothetical protein
MDDREPIPTEPDHLHAIASEWQGRACYRIGPETDVHLRGIMADETGYEGMILRCLHFEGMDGMAVLSLTSADGEKFRIMIRENDLRWILDNPVVDPD